ncbi:MAG: sterol desaturase family protein, partial [Novosphingobium sp.]|nr:sterol desaturase family protein [Novosphingobium sp.]
MHTPLIASLAAQYHWQLSLLAAVGIAAVTFVGKQVVLLVPSFRAAYQLNQAAQAEKMLKPSYAANQKLNRKWGLIYWAVAFAVILPFCLTLAPQPWWRIVRDIAIILMFYDFFYYLVHRFVFHDEGFLGGPLMWVHAVHHRQHNPCRADSSFIHPLEVALGLGLYVASIFV